MRKYRSRTEIIKDILIKASDGPVIKTQLMYGAYLSFAQMNEYLVFMLKNELLEYSDDNKTFIISPKGFKYLETFQELNNIANDTI